MREYLGHAIHDGRMLYTSVSSVKMYASWSKGGCARRWLYARVLGMKEAEADRSRGAKDKGTALDKELKQYLRTGDKALSSLALKGLHILEKPGPDLAIDPQIYTAVYRDAAGVTSTPPPMPEGVDRPQLPAGWTVTIESPLTAAGIPFVGELDFAHARGHYRDDEGEYHDDPPGTVEVCDIKYKGNTKDRNGNSIMLLPTDLVRDIQMAGYGEWVGRVRPDTTHVRLTHCVFPEKDGSKLALPTKITRLHVLDDCHKTWAKVENTVREMKQLVAATTGAPRLPSFGDIQTFAESADVESVAALAPGVTESCDAYGGCHHRTYCTAYRQNSLDNLYGKIVKDHVAANNANAADVYAAQQHSQEGQVGLLSNNPQMMNAAALAQPDMRQQLADEETRQRQQIAQQQQQMPQQLNVAELSQVCIRLNGYGYGFPTLASNAAQAYAMVGGQSIAPGVAYPGVPAQAGARRSLHGIQLTEVAHIYQLEGELAKELAASQPTPAPTPAPVQQAPAPVQQGPMSFLPPDAPQSMTQLAMQRPGYDTVVYIAPPTMLECTQIYTVGAPATPAIEAPKASRGRPKKDKSQDAAPGPIAAESQEAPPSSPPVHATQVAPAASSPTPVTNVLMSASFILINARFSSVPTKPLNEYVDYINQSLAKRYSVTADGKQGILDVRCAPKDSPLAFGGWKGAVREVVKADPPPEGMYHLDTFADELTEAVADALRVVADTKGWMYVRGMRG